MSRSKKCSSKSGKLSENSSRKIMSWILRGKSFLRIEERARSRSEGFELHLWRREPPCWKSSMRDSQSCGERGFWDMVCVQCCWVFKMGSNFFNLLMCLYVTSY